MRAPQGQFRPALILGAWLLNSCSGAEMAVGGLSFDGWGAPLGLRVFGIQVGRADAFHAGRGKTGVERAHGGIRCARRPERQACFEALERLWRIRAQGALFLRCLDRAGWAVCWLPWADGVDLILPYLHSIQTEYCDDQV